MPQTETDVEVQTATSLEHIADLDRRLADQHKHWLRPQPTLNRTLVSFQANKGRAIYRWYKYKEGFAADLVRFFLKELKVTSRARLLDPFSGSGTSLFVASERGIDADGVELLPIGQQIVAARQIVESGLSEVEISTLEHWARTKPWHNVEGTPLLELKITQGAYPDDTYKSISGYMAALEQESIRLQTLLRFALLCVLESVSYTRKDGQYLRWDYRSNRKRGARPFDKGAILPFDNAICAKLQEIVDDLRPQGVEELFDMAEARTTTVKGTTKLIHGSCLDTLQTMKTSSYDVIITSPPYCNRYDYTRTYALELALLGVDTVGIVQLRQAMLSCTVENRPKELTDLNPNWGRAIAAADQQELLQALLAYLEKERAEGRLNNAGIPRMVRGYFYEMACVIQECGRVLKPGAPLIMVNDNVRYAGANVSVDLILSEIATRLGFKVEAIYVLPSNKGNSSQQMGAHGREPLRKCVYQWRKEH